MTKQDFLKSLLDLLKLWMTGIFGGIFLIILFVIQNFNSNNIDFPKDELTIYILIFLFIICFIAYLKYTWKLKDE